MAVFVFILVWLQLFAYYELTVDERTHTTAGLFAFTIHEGALLLKLTGRHRENTQSHIQRITESWNSRSERTSRIIWSNLGQKHRLDKMPLYPVYLGVKSGQCRGRILGKGF